MSKGFWELFSDSLKEYGDKFVSILKIFLFLYVIPIIILVFIGAVIFFGLFSTGGFDASKIESIIDLSLFNDPSNFLLGGAFIVFFIISILLIVLINVLMSVSYIYLGFSKKGITFSQIFAGVRNYFWRYVGLTIILGVLLIILFMLLIVPGIIFIIFWIFSTYILIRENVGPWEAMKRSKALVKGRWWKVFGNVLLLTLIVIVISLVFGFIPLIGQLISPLVLTPFFILFLKNYYMDLIGKKQ